MLAGAGEAASALFKPHTEFVLTGVELASSGHGAPVGDTLRFALDYSVALRVKQIGIDGLGVSMVDNQPMRVRVRKVALTYSDGGVSDFKLDYDGAELKVESPGAWQLEGLGRLKDLFDVIGSRTGRGSMWIEVAACLLRLTALCLHQRDLAGALRELPFVLLPLLIVYLQYPLGDLGKIFGR